MAGRQTPVMEQYARAKRAYPDAILFFRLGDFYEMFEEDALLASKLLDLTLTSRNKGKPDEVPMAGVPHHAAHGYIARLLALGRRVALCEQMADPSKTRGIVPREVVRVVSPGVLIADEHLASRRNNWLAALVLGRSEIGVALLDVSTSALEAASLPDLASALAELSRLAPSELVLAGEAELVAEALPALRAVLGDLPIEARELLDEAELRRVLGVLDAERAAFGAAALSATAQALAYARACNPGSELAVERLVRLDPGAALEIGATARRHLELVSGANGDDATSLLRVLDETVTAPGARLLRRRLLAPLRDPARIARRLDAVESLVKDGALRERLRVALAELGDLERIVTRACYGDASPRDLGALRDGLAAARAAAAVLEGAALEVAALHGVAPDERVDTLDELCAELGRKLADRPPPRVSDGEILRSGWNPELDELDALRKHGAERMVELEQRLRQETGVPSLKVRYTRVFGWYIEVTRAQQARVPPSFRRKQTVAGGERYSTEELDELAARIEEAEERHRELELEHFRELCRVAARGAARVRALAARTARWDVSAALALVAHRYDYVRPEVDASERLEIRDGRHPVVERLAARGRFVPNDVSLDVASERLWLVTGPNMAGKSTLLRQTALTVILAQVGSFVPARFARIGVVDRVLSRVGASDDLSRGESTFMVEMRECAEILRSATTRSLVILDEIGRGTSTFDGLSIAWAVAEHLDRVIGCRALFATHYHELTRVADDSRHAANVSVSAREEHDEVVFLHRLGRGPASRSYGVAVAKLAGLPESVLSRARALLAQLEAGQGAGRKPVKPSAQVGLFEPGAVNAARDAEVIASLRGVDVERLSPLDAHALVVKLRARLD